MLGPPVAHLSPGVFWVSRRRGLLGEGTWKGPVIDVALVWQVGCTEEAQDAANRACSDVRRCTPSACALALALTFRRARPDHFPFCPLPASEKPSTPFDSLSSKRVVFSHVRPGSPPSLPVLDRFPVFPGPSSPFPVRALPAPVCHPQPRASGPARAALASPTATLDDVTTAPTSKEFPSA